MFFSINYAFGEIINDEFVDQTLKDKVFDKVNNIIILDINPFSQREEFSNKIQEIVKENAYDTVISNDLALPFGNLLIHSHSLIYRNKNCKNFLITLFQNFQSFFFALFISSQMLSIVTIGGTNS